MSRFGSRLFGATPVAQWLTSRGASIKSIQRGTITINNNTSGTATVTEVVPANSVLVFLGASIASTSAAASVNAVRITLTNGTTVTANINTAEAVDHVIAFELIEYHSGVLRSVQRGTIALAGASSNTASITAVTVAKSSVGYLGYTSIETTNRGVECIARVALTNGTTVTATVGGAVTVTVGYQVVEFY